FGERAMVVMPERVRRRFRKLRNSVRGLRSNSPMEDYHLVRRRAKQLRYAIESGALMFGKPAEDELKALRRLQDELGAHQDAYMARNRLAALAADPANELPAGTLFLMGRLAERHSTTTAQARKSLIRSWRKVRGQRCRAAAHARGRRTGPQGRARTEAHRRPAGARAGKPAQPRTGDRRDPRTISGLARGERLCAAPAGGVPRGVAGAARAHARPQHCGGRA